MWLVAEYRPVALFTLKSGLATATGAKTLLTPTPFAIRTALLDVAIRTEGAARGPEAFETIRHLALALRPPPFAVVTNLFAKILKPARADKGGEEAMQRTIAFREYVHWQGNLTLAFGGEGEDVAQAASWLPHLTYLGRRGGFVQMVPPVRQVTEDEVPEGLTVLTHPLESADQTFPLGVMQMLDDWGPTLTYEKVNVFDPAPIRRPGAGEDRLRYGVVLPYQFRQAGRGFTLYERIGD